MKVDPLIQEWYDVYTKYLYYILEDKSTDNVISAWSELTMSLINYYHETNDYIWKNDFVKFISCYTDFYKRQTEHLEYVGYNRNVVESKQGRYWK